MMYESFCPECPGDDVSTLHPVDYERGGGEMYMLVECLDCGHEWWC